jgi:hypothetical protein
MGSEDGHFVHFLPFLRLAEPVELAGVTFVPLRDGAGLVAEPLAGDIQAFDRILSSYFDRHGAAFNNCVPTRSGRPTEVAR